MFGLDRPTVARSEIQAPRASVDGPAASERYLIVCPTHRDLREIALIAPRRTVFLEHDYASLALEAIAGASAPTSEVPDPIDEIERILAGVGRERLTGVVSTDDYPGTTLAAAIAESLGLPAPSPTANLLCQHKYLARLAQREFAPEAVPAFSLIDVDKPGDLGGVCLPAMVKPVKSFFSVGATQIWGRLR